MHTLKSSRSLCGTGLENKPSIRTHSFHSRSSGTPHSCLDWVCNFTARTVSPSGLMLLCWSSVFSEHHLDTECIMKLNNSDVDLGTDKYI